jgi:hypothetical protein
MPLPAPALPEHTPALKIGVIHGQGGSLKYSELEPDLLRFAGARPISEISRDQRGKEGLPIWSRNSGLQRPV